MSEILSIKRKAMAMVVSSCAVLASLLISVASGAQTYQSNVWTQHNDNWRDGTNSTETTLTPTNVPRYFGMLFKVEVDDQLYTQPLYVRNVSINGGTHNVVYLATANNSLYAFDADSGVQYWKKSLTLPGMTAFTVVGTPFNCGDILGSSGVMGTPVINISGNSLYIVTESWNGPPSGSWNSNVTTSTATASLHSINISTGAENSGSPVTVAAPGFIAAQENQRPGLLYNDGNVYFSYAGHCDHIPWQGFTFAYNATTLAQVGVFNASQTNNGAGIWMSGNGLAADSSNNVYLISGNGGQFDSANNCYDIGGWNGSSNFSESFLKFNSSLGLNDFYTPSEWQTRDCGDLDLTSSGPLLIPGTSLVLGGGKDGKLRLINTASMGELDASGDTHAVQTWQASSSHIHSMNYWNGSLYIWGQNDYFQQFAFNGSTFNTTATHKLSRQAIQHPGGILSLSANGNSNGVVWATTNATNYTDNQGAWHATLPGVMYAYNAADISNGGATTPEIFSTAANPTRDACDNFAKFQPPTITNGKVYVPSFGQLSTASGQLCVYGLLSSTPLIPNGTYTVTSVHSSLALGQSSGTTVEQLTPSGGLTQKWTVTNLGDNVITLTNGNTGTLLEIPADNTTWGTAVDLAASNGNNDQKWRVTSIGAGKFELINMNSGIALDVVGGSTSSGAGIDQYGYYGNSWQQWSFTPASGAATPLYIPNGNYVVLSAHSGMALTDPGSGGSGTDQQEQTETDAANQVWTVTNVSGSPNVIALTIAAGGGHCLEIGGALLTDGAHVDLSGSTTCTLPQHRWQVVPVGNGAYYELVNVNSGKVLDVTGGVATSGQPLDQYGYFGNPWQQWIFRAQ